MNMKIQQIISAFVQGWWIIIAILLIGVGSAVLYSYSQPEVYKATATFLASSRLRTTDPGDLIDSQDTLAARSGVVTTYCAILESKSMVEKATRSLRLPAQTTNPYQVSCVVLPGSSVLSLEVQGPSPHLAADLANEIGTVGLNYISDLQEVYEIQRLDTATVNPNPVSPDHVVNITMGSIISLMGGIAIILLKEGLANLLDDHGPMTEFRPPAADSQVNGAR